MSFRPTLRLLSTPTPRVFATTSSILPSNPRSFSTTSRISSTSTPRTSTSLPTSKLVTSLPTAKTAISLPTSTTTTAVRTFVSSTSSKTPKPATLKKSLRIYTDRKAYLYANYTHLLKHNQLVLLFKHDNLSAADSQRLRTALKRVPIPQPQSTIKGKNNNTSITLTITRTGVLSAIETPLIPWLQGPTALLTCPTISPTYLTQILRVITRTIKQGQRENITEDKQPKFQLVVGLLEGKRLMPANQVEQVAKLDELDTLRSMVVGLLEGSGRNLLGVLETARGGGLVRTLQGLEKDLQDNQGGGSGEAPSA
ncbi:hypothetical protein BCR39DRAFT_535247 [Naematelia encephala]|uniref:Ribosomal protein L10-domain-containing protein n=1 Tax=Naematelia encephala TaxID=71784 RepID=A0A1Y2B1B4_9TREE|nr:hypothetical protein BCR39DRAFT_535247 [Naematelia encephala]